MIVMRNSFQNFRSVSPGKRGQSLIEFILVNFIFFTFFFVFLRFSLSLGYGSYVHHAVFMAARAYFAGSVSQRDQQTRGRAVLESYLGEEGSRLSTLGAPVPEKMKVGAAENFSATDGDLMYLQGATFGFKFRMFYQPLIPLGSLPNPQLDLVSETWLGREPTTQECTSKMGAWLYDNGC